MLDPLVLIQIINLLSLIYSVVINPISLHKTESWLQGKLHHQPFFSQFYHRFLECLESYTAFQKATMAWGEGPVVMRLATLLEELGSFFNTHVSAHNHL